MLELLWRCLRETGHISPREIVTFVRAMVEADASLGGGRRDARRRVTQAVARIALGGASPAAKQGI